MSSSALMQYLLTGLSQGGLYSLVGLGFVLIYNVTGIINFAQGEFVMLGAMLTVTFQHLGLPVPLEVTLAVAGTGLIGAVLHMAALRPLRSTGPLTLVIITIGLSMALRGIALLVWGTDPLVVRPFTSGAPLRILGGAMMRQQVWILGATATTVVALYVFLDRTVIGKAFRACMINPTGATLMGIDIGRMSTMAFAMGAAIGALCGAVFSPTLASYDMGIALGVKGFVAAVLGGLTSVPGVILSGFIIGIAESVGTAVNTSGQKDAIALIIMLAILLLRPRGLFGIYRSKRV